MPLLNVVIHSGTNGCTVELTAMHTTVITVLERPIARIKETCEMMGVVEKFDQALPDLETYLEGEVAAGEISETRLTYHGLVFLKEAFASLRHSAT